MSSTIVESKYAELAIKYRHILADKPLKTITIAEVCHYPERSDSLQPHTE